MDSTQFWKTLKSHGITFCSGVPDSTFSNIYQIMFEDPDICYVPAVREDIALGVASAAYFNSEIGAVIMQNSGIGNLINPLTSFNLMYKIPVLIIVGWRGYTNDAPEHEIMGRKTLEFFDLLEMPYKIPDDESLDVDLDVLVSDMRRHSLPGALIVRSGVIQ
jgi:phosphonopyruvate decarboxylase